MTVNNMLIQAREERESMKSELELMRKSVNNLFLRDKRDESIDSDSDETILQSPSSFTRSRPSTISCTIHKVSNPSAGTNQSMQKSAVPAFTKGKTRKKKVFLFSSLFTATDIGNIDSNAEIASCDDEEHTSQG